MEKRPKSRTILVVEDEPEVLNLTSRVLELEGYQVLRATDGQSGCSIIRENAIDLLLLDLKLPGVDGWSVLRQIMTRSMPARPSVVVITASAEVSEREEAFNMGAAAYLVKPVNIVELVGTVGNILCI